MSRIRTIKPEFPQSESMGRLSRDARLLFIMLWTIVDDAGRTRAASRMLASLLFPYDDDAAALIDGWLDELEREKCIRRYEVNGSQYLEVCNWLKHQKIDRPSKSRLPDFDEASRTLANPREASENLAADLGPGPGPGPILVPSGDGTPTPKKPVPRKERYDRPYSADFDRFWAAYPDRAGSRDKKEAWVSFQIALDNGADLEAIISGASAYRDAQRKLNHIGTPYVKLAATWLNQHSWEDYAASPSTPASTGTVKYFAKSGSPQWLAWDAYLKTKGMRAPDRSFGTTGRGYYFDSEWPPGYQPETNAIAA
jgi:hypothetical protein